MPHPWILESLELYEINRTLRAFVQSSVGRWKTSPEDTLQMSQSIVGYTKAISVPTAVLHRSETTEQALETLVTNLLCMDEISFTDPNHQDLLQRHQNGVYP